MSGAPEKAQLHCSGVPRLYRKPRPFATFLLHLEMLSKPPSSTVQRGLRPLATVLLSAIALSSSAQPAQRLADHLPPLPFVPSPRPRTVVEDVYAFAARRPDILKYVPCFCGCENSGHKGNDDCFVAARDVKGRVTRWDAHGMG